ncbi:MAG TPA: S53 family peptidase [Mycobacteriales bacterium]
MTLAGTQPAWAQPARATGDLSSSKSVAFSVVLPLRDAAGAERLAQAVSTPGRAQYRHYVSAAQFDARFAPSSGTVHAVTDFLKAQGFTVSAVAQGNRWVEAAGSAAKVNRAFGTQLKNYTWKGRQLRAPSKAVSVPSSISSSIAGVTGLDTGALLRRPLGKRVAGAPAPQSKPSAAPAPSQCSQFFGQHSQTVPAAYSGQTQYPTYGCGYTPNQLQGAYGVKSAISKGRDGHGVTVAITDAYASPTMKADANTYSGLTGIPQFAAGQYSQKVFQPFGMQKECGGEAGWNGEETLDVEAVHGMAAGANVLYVGAKDCDQGLDQALNYIVQNHSADLISNSWGNNGEDVPAAELAKEHSIFVQSAAEGIGMYFSSGDSGDELANVGSTQPDYPASDPTVTAVGGTSLGVGAADNYLFETGWGTALDRVTTDFTGYQEPLPGSFSGGAGGGTSTLWKQPAYQQGVVKPSLSRKFGGKAMRVVPDVATVADPYTGFLVGQTSGGKFGTYAIGGTSVACPVFAGIQALASQGLSSPLGFANPTLYGLAGTKAFRDVLPTRTPTGITNPTGSYLVTLDRDSSLQTGLKYDDVTGNGSPNGTRFLNAESGN